MSCSYESYLWEQERRYYQSCAVLFGSLIQLKRLHTTVPQKPLSTAETNTLNMSATVPRFTYLPIRYYSFGLDYLWLLSSLDRKNTFSNKEHNIRINIKIIKEILKVDVISGDLLLRDVLCLITLLRFFLNNVISRLDFSAPLFSVTKASPLRPRRTASQEENDAVWRASVHSDDASVFSFSDSQSQNSQGVLQQLMGVRVSFPHHVICQGIFGLILVYNPESVHLTRSFDLFIFSHWPEA